VGNVVVQLFHDTVEDNLNRFTLSSELAYISENPLKLQIFGTTASPAVSPIPTKTPVPLLGMAAGLLAAGHIYPGRRNNPALSFLPILSGNAEQGAGPSADQTAADGCRTPEKLENYLSNYHG
jgi:hypothetical protein